MRQEAPDPEPLAYLVKRLGYRPGWTFELADIDRGQGSAGLTLVITTMGYDCQPPGTLVTVARADWRSARHEQVPIEELASGDRVVSFTRRYQEFVIQGRPLTRVGSHPFHGDLVVAKVGGMISRYTPNHRCLVQVGDAFQDRFVVYLMRRGQSFRVGRARGEYLQGGKRKIGAIQRAYTEAAERSWILGVYDDEGDAAVAEAAYSWEFGIPTLTFRASNRPSPLTQGKVDDFWYQVGALEQNARALLAAVGREIDYPFWEFGSGAGGLGTRHLAEIRACNLLPGMRMVPFRRDRARGDCVPIEVHRERYDGAVYSLEVAASDPLYIADGVVTHNSYHPERGENYGVNHYMPVPPAAFDIRSWQRWLFDQCLLVERHEAMEFFAIHDSPGSEHAVRPYAPSHGPGNDPYIVREVGTDMDRRTSFRGDVNPA